MPLPAHDGGGGGDAGDGPRSEPIGGGAVAELAGAVGAPAAYTAVGEERAAVALAGDDRDSVRQTTDDDGREAVTAAHTVIAELARGVRAPTARRAVHEHGTTVSAARGDGDGIDDAAHECGAKRCSGRAVADLTKGIRSPTAHGAILVHPAAVLIAD